MSGGTGTGWFAVRCVLRTSFAPESGDTTYEERITLWRAPDASTAIARAEEEAAAYATTVFGSRDAVLGLAQSYRLADEPGDGAEVFSLMRDSALAPESYLDAFFDTGAERQRDVSR